MWLRIWTPTYITHLLQNVDTCDEGGNHEDDQHVIYVTIINMIISIINNLVCKAIF